MLAGSISQQKSCITRYTVLPHVTRNKNENMSHFIINYRTIMTPSLSDHQLYTASACPKREKNFNR